MRRIVTLLSFLFMAAPAMSQTLRGLIISDQTGETIIGAVIKADGTTYHTVSGLDGSFVIRNMPKGDYKITVSMVGFITETRNLKLDNGIVVLPVIKLKTDQKELSTITITTTQQKNNDLQARNLERTANQVMNIVSARAIEISPDLTVANVIQRVSGITIERNNTGDGQYALLRGMDKRYNYTLVNGVKIPSPDNKNRFVPLDIFPAELLDRLEVTKSLTPDMEGDGIGGAINLVMKDAPAKLLISANIATGFNTLFFDRPFYTYDKSQIQTQSPYELLGAAYPSQSRDFNPGLLDVKKMGTKPNLYGGISLGDRFFKGKFGVLVAGTYQNSLRGSNGTYFSFNTATSDASNLPVLTNRSYRTFSEEQTRAGLHGKLDYRLSENHKLQFYGAFLDFGTYQVRDDRRTDLSVGYDPENNNYNLSYNRRFRYTHQQISNNTLKGDHSFFGKRFAIDWSAVYSKATNEVPDNSQVHMASTVRKGVENPKSVVVLGGAERRWEHNSDEDKAGYLNFRYSFGSESMPVIISAGGMYRDKQRTNFFNEYQFRPLDDSKPAGTQTNLIEGTDWNSYSGIKFTVFNPFGSPGDPLNYGASEKIGAGYLQGKLTSKQFEVLAGARVENTSQGYHLEHVVAGLQNEGEQEYTDLLPSINLKFKLNDKTNLRTSYYEAVNRPSFFEIVPYRVVNDDFTEAGNPNLKHTVAHNADVRYELFPKASEQLMVGAFYKKISNPIEFGMVLQGQGSFYMPANFGDAANYGLELDYTKYAYNFGIKVNYTYTNSNITTTKLLYFNNPDPSATEHVLVKNVDEKRRLAGQAAHVANFTLLYKSIAKGINAQMSLAYTGDRLFAVSRYVDNDIWQSGFVQLDASAEKKFGNRYVVFAKATNLLNTPVKDYVKAINPANNKAPGYETFHHGTMTRSDTYGQTVLVGLRFSY
ncbi:TonB-dependent receptor [Hufsiella ginkgonis]|uniref:TonB-dependent receptor n=1 Tax=Hufsiella ginkgonis TaxID=2695274 RepID=A0A7K1XZW8_9SPHI|nr:TonB-dependent receptor [Hufsiella ginkgonis]MXV16561.1 TonB-dependent receptor [Hufsiella ginkgonis]